MKSLLTCDLYVKSHSNCLIKALLHFSNRAEPAFFKKHANAPLLFLCFLTLGGHYDISVRVQSLDLMMRLGLILGMSVPIQQKAKRIGLQVAASSEQVFQQSAIGVSEV
jgi:hypothetical protein